ncbi:unnamed protein product [Prunus armeniaca]
MKVSEQGRLTRSFPLKHVVRRTSEMEFSDGRRFLTVVGKGVRDGVSLADVGGGLLCQRRWRIVLPM